MAFVCMDCYTVFNSELIKTADSWNGICPVAGCGGDLANIDEMILPAIILLNKKGWKTKYCCSGHVYGNAQAYVVFEDYIYMLPSIPKGFRLDEKSATLTIRSTNKFKWDDARSAEHDPLPIYKNAVNLYLWAEKLPDIETYLGIK